MNVCPSCKTKIYNPSASFCYKCGHRVNQSDKREGNKLSLAQEAQKDKKNEKVGSELKTVKNESVDKSSSTSKLTKDSTSFNEKPLPKSTISSVSEDKLTKRWNLFVLGVNALSVMFLIVSLGLFFRANKEYVASNFDPTVEVSLIEVEDEEVTELESRILVSEFSSIVPKGPKLYVEASNLTDVFTELLNNEQVEYLESTYELSIEDFLVFLKPSYAYVRNEVGSNALIVETAGFDFFERTYSNYQENKVQGASVITARVGEFLVISEDESYINLIADVEVGTSPSIDSDPIFRKSVDSISGTPYLFIFTESFDYVLGGLSEELETLGYSFLYDEVEKAGTSSVYVTKEGRKYFVRPLELD